MLTASARTGRNVHRLLVEAAGLAERASQRIPTRELNRFLGEVTQAQRPGERLNLLYMTQTGTARRASPPRSTTASG